MHRVTIYWKIETYRVHALQMCAGLPMNVSLNGEQYLDVDDEQYQRLLEYQRQGLLEFRHKELAVVNGSLQPVSIPGLTNNIQRR